MLLKFFAIERNGKEFVGNGNIVRGTGYFGEMERTIAASGSSNVASAYPQVQRFQPSCNKQSVATFVQAGPRFSRFHQIPNSPVS